MKSLKGISLFQLNIACLTVLSFGLPHVYADESGHTLSSTASVTFKPNSHVMPPVDPEGEKPNTPVVPWDPTNPEGKPEPGMGGPLELDFVSSFDFGKNEISNEDATYYARAQTLVSQDGEKVFFRPNYVQVTDNRGTDGGWVLSVKQEGQLKSVKETFNDKLTGSVITLKSPAVRSNSNSTPPVVPAEVSLSPDGSEQRMMTANINQGLGTWTDAWGKSETVKEYDEAGKAYEVWVNKAVSLFVPGETPKDAVEYRSTLRWTLSELPENQEL